MIWRGNCIRQFISRWHVWSEFVYCMYRMLVVVRSRGNVAFNANYVHIHDVYRFVGRILSIRLQNARRQETEKRVDVVRSGEVYSINAFDFASHGYCRWRVVQCALAILIVIVNINPRCTILSTFAEYSGIQKTIKGAQFVYDLSEMVTVSSFSSK